VNELPPGWVNTSLGNVAKLFGGSTPKGVLTAPPGDVPFYKVSDMNASNGDFMADARVTVTKDTAAALSLRVCPAGTVIFPKVGGALHTNKKRILSRSAAIDTNTMAPVPISAIEPRFLFYWLSTIRLSEFAYGAPVPQVHRVRLAEKPLALPPLTEQRRIIAALEEQFSRLDMGVALLDRIRHNLKRMRAAMLEAAVSSVQDAGTPPVALGDLIIRGRKVAYGVLVPGNDVPDGIPFVRVGDLKNRAVNTATLKRISPSIAARYPRTSLQGGEVLLSLVGTIGRTAVVPPELAGANIARALALIPVRDDVDPRYVAIALSRSRVTADLTSLSHEVARKTLNLEDVKKYHIPMPPHEKQLEVIELIEGTEVVTVQGLSLAVPRSVGCGSISGTR
jgi:hypothetical protein